MDRTIMETFTAICWTVATPLAYQAVKAAERGDWAWLVSKKINPASYTCPHTYLGDAQVLAYLSKFPDFDLGYDLEAKARDNFWECERECYKTNERLNPLIEDPMFYGEEVKTFLTVWRGIVRKCLGPVPNLSALLSNGKFGPGSTYANRGDLITLADKLDSGYTITEPARKYLPYLEDTAWLRYAARGIRPVLADHGEMGVMYCYEKDGDFAEREFTVVRGNRFTTVSKNATARRGICIEASANVFMQLAVGDHFSLCMRKSFSWDKRTCQQYHQLLARLGSLTGANCTVDLKNASDTVATNLVRLGLPPAWFRLLDDLRSPFTQVGERWVKLEKFSSMGNGFTFELETLLFRTLIETVRVLKGTQDPFALGADYSVFGDDIIIPREHGNDVIAALRFFGFTTNKAKTFLEGPFRESCGGDYFRGYDVRPTYVRKDLVEPADRIALANGIRRFRMRYSQTGWFITNLKTVRIWRIVIDSLPLAISECRGPEILGDLVVHDDEVAWSKRVRVRNSIRYLRVWRPVVNRVRPWDDYRPGVVMACALYGVPSGAPPIDIKGDAGESWRRAGIVPRVNGSYISGYRFGRVPFS